MAVIHDEEFGKITIRRSARASQVKLRVGPDGTLRASLPLYAPTFLIKRLIKTSRHELRELMVQSSATTVYTPGMRIGKSHMLEVGLAQTLSVKRIGQRIVAGLPAGASLGDPGVVKAIREVVQVALRVEAKSYLPKRLSYLAAQHGFHYSSVRFSHASGRWGSCSSQGTISLNIALMKLPFELIDYVLIHELAHTRHLNHSEAFWQTVASADPLYKEHRRALKQESPTI